MGTCTGVEAGDRRTVMSLRKAVARNTMAIEHASAVFGIDIIVIQRWVALGRLRCIKHGKAWCVDLRDLGLLVHEADKSND